MMKKILLFIALITGVAASGQIFQPYSQYGNQFKRSANDSALFGPTGCGSPAGITKLKPTDRKQYSQYFDSCAHRLWYFDPKTATWDSAHLGAAAGGGGGVSDFSAGDLSPLFTSSVATSTTTPALTFSLADAAAYTIYGRGTTTGPPSFLASIDSNWIPTLHSEEYYNTKYAVFGSSAPILPSTEIAFGNGVDPYVSTPDFIRDEVGGIFKSIFTGGNNTELKQDDAQQLLTYGNGSGAALSVSILNSVFSVSFPSINFDGLNFTADIGGGISDFEIQSKIINQGDIGGSGNGTTLNFSDPNQLLTYQKGSDVYWKTDIANSVGEWSFPSGNNTSLLFDDFNSSLQYKKGSAIIMWADATNTAFYAGDVSFSQNHTWLNVYDPDQKLTFQKDADIYFSTDIANLTGFWGNPGGNATSISWDDASGQIQFRGQNGSNTIGIFNGLVGAAGGLQIDYMEELTGSAGITFPNTLKFTSGGNGGNIYSGGDGLHIESVGSNSDINLLNNAGGNGISLSKNGSSSISAAAGQNISLYTGNVQLYVDEPTRSIFMTPNQGGIIGFLCDFQNTIYSFGNVSGAGNGTKGIWDDFNRSITMGDAGGDAITLLFASDIYQFGKSTNIQFTEGTNIAVINATVRSTFTGPIGLKNYTVATLPAGTIGDIAYVTDALLPTFLVTVAGGGAVVTPVFYNGANWIAY